MTTKRILLIGITGLVIISIVGFGIPYASAQGPGGGGKGPRGGPGTGDGTGYGAGYHNGGEGCRYAGECLLGANLPPAVEGELPPEVLEAMTAGIMDEYNAYAIYQAVIDQFGAVRPFTSIQAAEARHIAAWEVIFNRYGVEIPEAPALDPVPEFASLTDACEVARDAELANIALYDKWLATVSNYPDITKVVTSLRDASRYNHLPAFERCAR